MTIRKARLADVPIIHALLAEAAKSSPVIPRSHVELYENIRNFFVGECDNTLVGCSALQIDWHDLAEVKSLAVQAAWRGKGIARALVLACVEEARAFDIDRVFALTGSPDLFVKYGFSRIEKSELPHKIWSECVRCPKFPDCDEEAVLLRTGRHVEATVPLPHLP
ncbi:TPA: N-acetyltransferase [Candidatus Sumerlaeota bacterium]|nr:N-acetyltransferase [Candidatus Sumerlaeota bacterium]